MRAPVAAAWLNFTGDIEGGDAAPVIYQDIRGKVIDELFTVVINPASANGGRGGFDPNCIDFIWRTR